MEQQDKKDGKRKKSKLIKVIIFIIVALLCYKIGSSILSGMKQAYTEQKSANPN